VPLFREDRIRLGFLEGKPKLPEPQPLTPYEKAVNAVFPGSRRDHQQSIKITDPYEDRQVH